MIPLTTLRLWDLNYWHFLILVDSKYTAFALNKLQQMYTLSHVSLKTCLSGSTKQVISKKSINVATQVASLMLGDGTLVYRCLWPLNGALHNQGASQHPGAGASHTDNQSPPAATIVHRTVENWQPLMRN